MSTLGLGIVVYVAYLLLWVVINFLVYFISIFFKKPAIYQTLAGISIVVAYIANFLIGLALLWYGITLLLDGRFVAFIFFFLIGSTIATFLIKIIQVPFYIITGYLSERLDEKNFDTIDAELVEDDESDSVVKKDMKNSEELMESRSFLISLVKTQEMALGGEILLSNHFLESFSLHYLSGFLMEFTIRLDMVLFTEEINGVFLHEYGK